MTLYLITFNDEWVPGVTAREAPSLHHPDMRLTWRILLVASRAATL
jgi:hypothetical protein